LDYRQDMYHRWDYITRFVSTRTGTVLFGKCRVPIEMFFWGVKDSGLGYKEGVVEAMKSYTTVKTYSLPW